MEPVLSASNINCSRPSGDQTSIRLESRCFECSPGTMNLLLGADSAHLFLRILGLLEKPDSGEVFFHGAPTSNLSPNDTVDLRSRHFGYVFPEPFLLPSLGVFENVAMPLFKNSEVSIEAARQKVTAALDFVGLRECDEPLAGELSLFDQLRVSLARALVHQPELLFLEGLDGVLAEAEMLEFIRMTRSAAGHLGLTAIFSAADRRLVPFMDRSLEL